MRRLLNIPWCKINWTITLFIVINTIVGIVGTIALYHYSGLMWQTLVLTFILMVLSGLSITCGYHRLFSHLTYKAKFPVKLLFALFGASNFEGSILEWCTDHRNHHRYTDTDKDPYNAKRGFWYSHIGWLFVLDQSKRDFSNVEDLQADPVVRIQHRFYVILAFIMSYGLPMAVAALWGDVWGGLIVAGALRIVIAQQGTFCINSVCHIWGKQTFSDRDTARDNWFTALYTVGEGFHNFHHKFPIDYRNGVRFFHFDPSKWFIRSLEYIGLASDLRRVSKQRIIQCRLEMDEKRITRRADKKSSSLLSTLAPQIQHARETVLETLNKQASLEKAYAELKQCRQDFIDKTPEYRKRIQDVRMRLKVTRLELKGSLVMWAKTLARSRRAVAQD